MSKFEQLDKQYAYLRRDGGTPIRNDGQIPYKKLKRLVTKAPDTEWQANIDSSIWWSRKNLANNISTRLACGEVADPRFIQLNNLLLSFGGYETCFPTIEEDMADILERGQFWLGDHSILMKGEESRCHSNTANLWEANRNNQEVAIATGYALSTDGLWRQHSWLM